MKKIIILMISLIFLFWCGKQSNDEDLAKKDFFIKIEKLNSLWNNSYLNKSWKIEWKEDIVLASQAIWRVWKINVKVWDKVKSWQVLINLQDTVANYNLNLKKVENSIEKWNISYDSTKVSLDKQIYDSEIALEKLKNSLETLKENTKIDIAQAKENLTNTNYSWSNSKSSIELEKLNNSIDKANFDYNNALTSNKEAVENFKNLIQKEVNTQISFLNDIINFWDKLFDITWNYKDDVVKFTDYLWAKDQTAKEETKQKLINLNISKNNLYNLNFENFSDEALLKYLNILEANYFSIDSYLESFEETLINSIPSLWILSQIQIDGYINANNWFQTQFTAYNSAFVQLKNTSTTFLKTYKNNEESIAKQLDLLQKDKEIFLKNYDIWETQLQNTLDKIITSSNDWIKSLELQIKQTEETIKIAKQSRDLTLKWIDNSIKDAFLAKDLALKEIGKLSINASIDWVIKDIFVDEWQDVAIWVPLISITSNKSSELELLFKETELKYINVWDKIYTKIWEKNLTWSIYSISTISDDSLNYKVLAVFNEKIQNLWWVIEVNIPIESNSILLPLENIKFIWTNKGIINVYENWKIVPKEAKLWKMYKENIEFLNFVDWTKLSDNTYIVLTDVSNFDETKYTLKIEQ